MAEIKFNSKSKLSQENKNICVIKGCCTKVRFKGLCSKHYTEYLSKGYRECTVDGCKNKVRSAGNPYCEMHYGRIRRNGNIEDPIRVGEFIGLDGYVHKNCQGHVLQEKVGRWQRYHRIVLFDKIGPGKHNCHWCGKEVNFDLEYPKYLNGLVTDHLDENKQNNNPENLVPSCALCNLKRGVSKMIKTMQKNGIWIEFNRERKSLTQWANQIGITKPSLDYRLKKGWPLERALTEGRGRTDPRRKV